MTYDHFGESKKGSNNSREILTQISELAFLAKTEMFVRVAPWTTNCKPGFGTIDKSVIKKLRFVFASFKSEKSLRIYGDQGAAPPKTPAAQ